MAKRGPKRKYETPEALRAGVEEYFANCKEENNAFPDLAGMRVFLGISQATLKKYQDGDTDEARAYREILDWAKDVRESWLAKRMATDNKAEQGCMNNLKQPINGGYIDRPTETAVPEIRIRVEGVGGESAFK